MLLVLTGPGEGWMTFCQHSWPLAHWAPVEQGVVSRSGPYLWDTWNNISEIQKQALNKSIDRRLYGYEGMWYQSPQKPCFFSCFICFKQLTSHFSGNRRKMWILVGESGYRTMPFWKFKHWNLAVHDLDHCEEDFETSFKSEMRMQFSSAKEM